MNKTQGVELEIRKDDGNTIWWYRNKGTLISLQANVSYWQQWQSGDRFPALNKFACGQVLTTRPLHFTLWPVTQ